MGTGRKLASVSVGPAWSWSAVTNRNPFKLVLEIGEYFNFVEFIKSCILPSGMVVVILHQYNSQSNSVSVSLGSDPQEIEYDWQLMRSNQLQPGESPCGRTRL